MLSTKLTHFDLRHFLLFFGCKSSWTSTIERGKYFFKKITKQICLQAQAQLWGGNIFKISKNHNFFVSRTRTGTIVRGKYFNKLKKSSRTRTGTIVGEGNISPSESNLPTLHPFQWIAFDISPQMFYFWFPCDIYFLIALEYFFLDIFLSSELPQIWIVCHILPSLCHVYQFNIYSTIGK